MLSELDISLVKNGDEYEYNVLVTRTNFHQRILTDKEKSQVQRRTNYLTRYISSGKHKNANKSYCFSCAR